MVAAGEGLTVEMLPEGRDYPVIFKRPAQFDVSVEGVDVVKSANEGLVDISELDIKSELLADVALPAQAKFDLVPEGILGTVEVLAPPEVEVEAVLKGDDDFALDHRVGESDAALVEVLAADGRREAVSDPLFFRAAEEGEEKAKDKQYGFHGRWGCVGVD